MFIYLLFFTNFHMVYLLYYEIIDKKLLLYDRDLGNNLRFLSSGNTVGRGIENTIRLILSTIPTRGGRAREFDFQAKIIKPDINGETVYGHYSHPGYRERRGI